MRSMLAPATPTESGGGEAADLAAWSRNHDEAAFARLVARHSPLVAATCRRILGPSDADEAIQAVFIVLARRADEIRSEQLDAWLHGVAIRVCRDVQRNMIRRIRREQASVVDSVPPPPADPDAAELNGLLDLAIATLSPAQRVVVIGHFLEGRTQAAVAESLGISESAVQMRLRYAMDKLRTWFARRGLTVCSGTLAACLARDAGASEPAQAAVRAQAALHPVAGSGPVVLADGVAASGSATLLLTIAAVLLGIAGAAYVCWRIPAPAHPMAVTIIGQPGPRLERILATRLVVHYQHDYLSEVLADLRYRVELDAGFPPGLDQTFTVSLHGEDVPVQTILEVAAQAGGLRLESRGDRLVYWRPADEGQLTHALGQLRSGDAESRIDAVHGLSRLGDPRIYPALFQALGDQDEQVARVALQSLRHHPLSLQLLAPVPTERLVAMAMNTTSRADVAAVCDVLGAGLAIAPLIELAQPSGIRDPHLRTDAIIALGGLCDPRAIDPLLGLLTSDHRHVAAAAVRALALLSAKIAAPQAVEPLIGMLRVDDATSRDLAMMALGRSGDARAVAPLASQLEDGNPGTRRMAAQALGMLRVPQAEETLRRLLQHADPEIRRLAGATLSQITLPQTVDLLAKRLTDADPATRQQIISALGDSHDPVAVTALIAQLGDADPVPDPRIVMLLALGRDPRAVAPLLARLHKPGSRQTVVTALCRLRNQAVVDACLDLLRSGDAQDRLDAATILGSSRDPRAEAALLGLLGESDAKLRIRAIEGLGYLHDPRLAAYLLPHLADADRSTADAAASALCQIFDLRLFDARTASALVGGRDQTLAFANVLRASPGLPLEVREGLAAWAASASPSGPRPELSPPQDF